MSVKNHLPGCHHANDDTEQMKAMREAGWRCRCFCTCPKSVEQGAHSRLVASPRELLAELEHDQWVAWSKDIAETEKITPARLERWKKLWRPYAELTEAEKDQDREWADKALAIFALREVPPMGVSQWLEHGKRYGYFSFFISKATEAVEQFLSSKKAEHQPRKV